MTSSTLTRTLLMNSETITWMILRKVLASMENTIRKASTMSFMIQEELLNLNLIKTAVLLPGLAVMKAASSTVAKSSQSSLQRRSKQRPTPQKARKVKTNKITIRTIRTILHGPFMVQSKNKLSRAAKLTVMLTLSTVVPDMQLQAQRLVETRKFLILG